MLTTFETLESWKAAAEAAGLIVELNSYEDVGDCENGPKLSYVPALGFLPKEVDEKTGGRIVLAIFFEEIGRADRPGLASAPGAVSDSAEELDAWVG